MSADAEKKRRWAESVIRMLDPSFRQRWDIYDGVLKRLTGPDARWLDAGCGKNIAVEEFPCALNVGLDRYRHPEVLSKTPVHFVMGDLESLPFRDGAFTLVSLNTVAEHIADPEGVFAEIHRVLTPGGHVLIHTTNVLSPPVLFGRFLPEPVRMRIFRGFLGANEQDVFPAYHMLNTTGAFRRIQGFEVEEIHTVQDLNWTNRVVFLGLLAYHMVTKLPGLRRFRTNIIALLRKER